MKFKLPHPYSSSPSLQLKTPLHLADFWIHLKDDRQRNFPMQLYWTNENERKQGDEKLRC